MRPLSLRKDNGAAHWSRLQGSRLQRREVRPALAPGRELLAAAQPDPASRSLRRMILPVAVMGRLSTKATSRGYS